MLTLFKYLFKKREASRNKRTIPFSRVYISHITPPPKGCWTYKGERKPGVKRGY